MIVEFISSVLNAIMNLAHRKRNKLPTHKSQTSGVLPLDNRWNATII